jgi:hypothetical protein
VSLELRERSFTVHIGETMRRGCGSRAASKHTMSIARLVSCAGSLRHAKSCEDRRMASIVARRPGG